jgi:hypothetical protein
MHKMFVPLREFLSDLCPPFGKGCVMIVVLIWVTVLLFDALSRFVLAQIYPTLRG